MLKRDRTSWRKFCESLDNGFHSLCEIFYSFAPIAWIITNQFHYLYYSNWRRTWFYNTTWFGVPVLKNPLDLWIYQEIFYRVKPDIIIETGTFEGGGALFYAHICDLLGHGQVVTIDTEKRGNRPPHPRISYLYGSSTSQEIFQSVQTIIGENERILVVLDSDHSKKHVLTEMKLYAKLVSIGSYLIVEDSNINGHPVRPLSGPGPMEAIRQFQREIRGFVIDKSCEKFYFTFNPKGYLKRVC